MALGIVAGIRIAYLASLERQARILNRILKVAVPRILPMLNPTEVAAVIALQLAVNGFLEQNPIPDSHAQVVKNTTSAPNPGEPG